MASLIGFIAHWKKLNVPRARANIKNLSPDKGKSHMVADAANKQIYKMVFLDLERSLIIPHNGWANKIIIPPKDSSKPTWAHQILKYQSNIYL